MGEKKRRQRNPRAPIYNLGGLSSSQPADPSIKSLNRGVRGTVVVSSVNVELQQNIPSVLDHYLVMVLALKWEMRNDEKCTSIKNSRGEMPVVNLSCLCHA